jgi:hypothetical protein
MHVEMPVVVRLGAVLILILITVYAIVIDVVIL